jgi:hypothetical protein
MLLLPKGQTIYSGLKTAFTQFDAMLADLGSSGFTGYVRVTARGYDGILLLDTGQVITALGESEGQRNSGPPAAQELAAQARATDGTIDVCKLSHEWVSILSGTTEAEPVFGKLNTDLVDLGALIKKLQNTRHTGYLRVTLRAQGGDGLILMQDGQVIESLCSPEDGTPPEQVLSRLVEAATTFGADIDVFKAEIERAFSHGESISATLGFARLLDIWQEIIQTVEKTADSLTENGAFADAFKSALDTRTHDYPFLDRFGVFFYEDGRLKYSGKPEQDFSRAVGECVSEAVEKLDAKVSLAIIRARIKVSLQHIKQERRDAIKEFGLESALDWELTPYERVLAEAYPFLGNSSERIVERQCREHLRLEPAAVTFDQLRELARWVEISSALVISKDQARALGRKIESLSAPA